MEHIQQAQKFLNNIWLLTKKEL